MLRWREVKPLITEIVGTRLLSMGFVNPGRSMWRYREHFVDVVAFRCDRYAQGFTAALGCSLRAHVRLHPAPDRCDFGPYALALARTDRFRRYIAFADDIPAQRVVLEALAPSVVDVTAMWFAQLETLETALESVANDPALVLRGAREGSPVHLTTMERLRDAMKKTRSTTV